jgi:uncharacterized protein (TIGR02145 family)
MSREDRLAMSDPAAGLVVYDTTLMALALFNGTDWTTVNGGFKCGISSFHFDGLVYGTVLYAGKCWLDRNLGATALPTFWNDPDGYGDYYQWGRLTDGHEYRYSSTTTTLAGSTTPGHDNFILNTVYPNDWLITPDSTLWRPPFYTNNPCPYGFKVPTEDEWLNASSTWTDRDDAYNSPLKITAGGGRSFGNGTVYNAGSQGAYWTSNVAGNFARGITFGQTSIATQSTGRGAGRSIRCVSIQ